METNTTDIHSIVGAEIAVLRKQLKITQAELAFSLPQKRTQAWISGVESGRRKLNISDLHDIAKIFGVPVQKLFGMAEHTYSAPEYSLQKMVDELAGRLPLEVPIFLQRDMSDPNAERIDYEYWPVNSQGSGLNSIQQAAEHETYRAMVVERYYSAPQLEPTDILVFDKRSVPRADANRRVTDRVVFKISEPLDGLFVHPGIVMPSGDLETTLSGQKTQVFTSGNFDVLGVLISRRTQYPTSRVRDWLRRKFGIRKDERVFDQQYADEH